MLNVFHQCLYRRPAISVMPCDDVVDRIGLWFSRVWAHVLVLLSQSQKSFPVLKGARPRAGNSVWHQVGNLPVLHQQTRVCHGAALLVYGDGISRNADVTRCHRARNFLGGCLIGSLPHFTRDNTATAVFELHDNNLFSVSHVSAPRLFYNCSHFREESTLFFLPKVSDANRNLFGVTEPNQHHIALLIFLTYK